MPSKIARPPNLALGLRVSPSMVMAVTDLPEPDSPTIATTSPGRTLNVTPSTALTIPSSVAKETWRSSTSSSAPSPALMSAQTDPWVEERIHDVDQGGDEHDEERPEHHDHHDRDDVQFADRLN